MFISLSKINEFVNAGFLRMKKYTDSATNTSYLIINYADEYKNHPVYSAYKSVILTQSEEDKTQCRVLAFAPPHGIDYTQFKEQTVYEMTEDIVANNAIEGTMIQLFYDHRINQWNIATRGSIGGHNRFYGQVDAEKPQATFRSMFEDCFNERRDIQEVFSQWPKNNSYCFVLQHPDNQIVFDVKQPQLHLVAAYKIKDTNESDIHEHVLDCIESSLTIEELNALAKTTNGYILVPQPYTFSRRYDELECVFRDAENCMGVMFWNTKTGQRAHMENARYLKMRELRGNHPNIMYQFLELHRENKALDFLQVFPRYQKQFEKFYDAIVQFSYMVYGAYINYYVKHDRTNVIPKEYFVHAAKIHHEIYVPNKKAGNKVIITPVVVRNYIENMEPIKLVYYLKHFYYGNTEVVL